MAEPFRALSRAGFGWKAVVTTVIGGGVVVAFFGGVALGSSTAPTIAIPAGPSTWIDAPLDGSTIPQAPYTVVAHATSSSDVTAFEFSVDGVIEQPLTEIVVTDGTLFSVTTDWTPPGPGTYTLEMRATDGTFGSAATAVVDVADRATVTTTTTEPRVTTTVPSSTTTVAQASTTTIAEPTTTQAPTTTAAPTTTQAPTTTAAPTTTQAPTTTAAPTTTTTTRPPPTTTTEAADTEGPVFLRVAGSPGLFYQGGRGCTLPTSITVTAVVTDPSGIEAATLFYRMVVPGVSENPGYSTVGMGGSGDTYQSTVASSSLTAIPAPGREPAPDGTLQFYVVARDGAGNEAQSVSSTATMRRCS